MEKKREVQEQRLSLGRAPKKEAPVKHSRGSGGNGRNATEGIFGPYDEDWAGISTPSHAQLRVLVLDLEKTSGTLNVLRENKGEKKGGPGQLSSEAARFA